jgi:hypothetical protein
MSDKEKQLQEEAPSYFQIASKKYDKFDRPFRRPKPWVLMACMSGILLFFEIIGPSPNTFWILNNGFFFVISIYYIRKYWGGGD